MNQPRKPHGIADEPDAINWREVCRKMLQLRRQLAGNLLISGIEIPIEDELGNIEDDFFNKVLIKGQSPKSKGKRLTIIGEPGAGKTAQLLKIADWLLDNSPDGTETELVKPLPIWISLAQVKKPLHQYLIEDWLREAAEKLDTAPEEWVEEFTKLLLAGKVWLLLDGADEMGIANPLGTLAQSLREPLFANVRVVISCRLDVWEAAGDMVWNFDTYKMLGFSYQKGTHSDQVKQFIDQWFNKDYSIFSDLESSKGSQLRAALEEPGQERIKDLARNPLHLSLLCLTWQSGPIKLPETKAELYQVFVEAFYELKKDIFPTTAAQRKNLNTALGQLALKAILQGYKSILPHTLVSDSLEKLHPELYEEALKLGWLNRVVVDAQNPLQSIYAFEHPTFLEYFAACEIENWQFFFKPVPQRIERDNYRIFEPQWQEVFLLWLGRVDVPAEQKEELITALVNFEALCGKWNYPEIDKGFYEYQAYFLAAAGITEFHQYSKSEEIVREIIKCGFGEFNIETQEWQTYLDPIADKAREMLPLTQRSKAIKALVEFIHFPFPPKENPWRVVKSLGKIGIGNPEAIRALVEIIRHSPSNRSRSIAVEILREIGTGNLDAITALVELTRNCGDEWTRLDAAQTLGTIAPGNPEAISALIELIRRSKSSNAYSQATESLEKIGIGNPKAIRPLAELTRCSASQETRSRAGYILEQICLGNPEAISALIGLVRHSQSKQTCSLGAYALGQIGTGNPEAISALVELTRKCEDDYARSCAASALGQIGTGNPEAICALVELTRNCQDKYTRGSAAESLGTIDPGNPEAISALVELARNYQDEDTAGDAAISLGTIDPGNPDAISALVELIRNCQDAVVVFFAVESLKKIGLGNSDAISALVELTRKPHFVYACSSAAYSLGLIDPGNPDAISALVELTCYSQDRGTRYSAADSLAKTGIGNPDAISTLVELTRNCQDEEIRYRAAESLGTIDPGNPEAINALVELTRNCQDKYTRHPVVYGLGKIATGNSEAISALVELTRNCQDEDLSGAAAYNLNKILATEQQMAEVVTALKDFLSNETYKNDFKRFKNCYEVIWQCAQNLPYPDFYQAWHRQPPIHPER